MENTTLSRTARTAGLFFIATTRAANAHFLQHHFQRAEIRERRLQQVEAHERGEPEPVRAVIMREQQAGQNEHAGEPADDEMHFHTPIPSRQRRNSYKPIAGIIRSSSPAATLPPDEKRFIEAWKRARIIVDSGGGHSGTPPRPPTPPATPHP